MIVRLSCMREGGAGSELAGDQKDRGPDQRYQSVPVAHEANNIANYGGNRSFLFCAKSTTLRPRRGSVALGGSGRAHA